MPILTSKALAAGALALGGGVNSALNRANQRRMQRRQHGHDTNVQSAEHSHGVGMQSNEHAHGLELQNNEHALKRYLQNNEFGFKGQQLGMDRDLQRELQQGNFQFQEHMASTAHQRSVKDMRKAGLNPVLGLAKPMGSSAKAAAGGGGGGIGKDGNLIAKVINSASRMAVQKYRKGSR